MTRRGGSAYYDAYVARVSYRKGTRVIEVTDKSVIRHKRSWFSHDEMSISINKVASVHIKTGIIWSDILIESNGGSDPLTSHGHTKGDAQRIRALVEEAQGIGPEKLKLS